MGQKPYRQRIIANLQMLSEWNDLEDGQSISEWSDSAVGEFFRTVTEDIEEEMKEASPKSSVALAFREAKLNPEIPFNWVHLLRAFADTHYRRKTSGQTKFDEKFRSTLRQRVQKIVDGQRTKNVLAACRVLIKQFPEDYCPEDDCSEGASRSNPSNHSREKAAEHWARALRFKINEFGWTSADFGA